jgi:NADH:ubiquinone oxidoreductase subunit K
MFIANNNNVCNITYKHHLVHLSIFYNLSIKITLAKAIVVLFLRIAQYNTNAQTHVHTLTSMNTHMQTLPL